MSRMPETVHGKDFASCVTKNWKAHLSNGQLSLHPFVLQQKRETTWTSVSAV